MSPQSIRGICIFGFVIICIAAAIAGEPQKTIDISPVVTVTTNEVDPELQSLLSQRYEAAKREAELQVDLYCHGGGALDLACGSLSRVATSGVESAESSDECLKRCEAALKMAKKVDDTVVDRFRNEIEPAQALALANYTRLDVEIRLHRARKEASK